MAAYNNPAGWNGYPLLPVFRLRVAMGSSFQPVDYYGLVLGANRPTGTRGSIIPTGAAD
jgi:hypothetical protein